MPRTASSFSSETGQLTLAAVDGVDSAGIAALHGAYPRPVARDTTSGRSILDRRLVHLEDSWLDPEYTHPLRDTIALRSILTVPIFREGLPIGALSVWRGEVKPFTDKQIALLETFADQAVIAIENVRLFKELEARNRDLTEALEQQTATSEILRVISSSPTDVQPVFDTIVRSAVRLCDGLFSALFQFDGELLHLVAQHNFTPEALEEARRIFPARPSRGLGAGRAILERAVVHIPDVEVDPEYQHQALSRAIGFRSGLFVPMLRDGAPIGVIMVARAEPGPFSDNEIELLKTFADQAVIAVENVRLFKELQARTGELTQSVEQLTALGEVSQAVSSTLDVETVLDTIVSHASQLAGAAGCAIYEYDEAAEQFELRATHGYDAGFVEALRAAPLRKGEGLMGRAAEMREPIQIPDITQPGAYESSVRDTLIRFGYRALLSVPAAPRGADHRQPVLHPEGARRVSARGDRGPEDLRHPVGAGDPERPALPGDRGQEPPARGREPAQVGVPGEHVARAAHAAERDHRLLRGAERAHVRRAEREAGGVPARTSTPPGSTCCR